MPSCVQSIQRVPRSDDASTAVALSATGDEAAEGPAVVLTEHAGHSRRSVAASCQPDDQLIGGDIECPRGGQRDVMHELGVQGRHALIDVLIEREKSRDVDLQRQR